MSSKPKAEPKAAILKGQEGIYISKDALTLVSYVDIPQLKTGCWNT